MRCWRCDLHLPALDSGFQRADCPRCNRRKQAIGSFPAAPRTPSAMHVDDPVQRPSQLLSLHLQTLVFTKLRKVLFTHPAIWRCAERVWRNFLIGRWKPAKVERVVVGDRAPDGREGERITRARRLPSIEIGQCDTGVVYFSLHLLRIRQRLTNVLLDDAECILAGVVTDVPIPSSIMPHQAC